MADPAPMPRSALHGVARNGRSGRPDGPPGVCVHLVWPCALALVVPRPGSADACLARLAAVYGPGLAGLPARRSARGDGLSLCWSGPDRYLAGIAADVDIEARLRDVCGDSAAIIDQSDGRFVLRISGPSVRRTLAKGVTIDLHPRVFQVGETALVTLAHLTVQLTLIDATPTFELVGQRAAAHDLWHWLAAAGAQFGVQTSIDGSPAGSGIP